MNQVLEDNLQTTAVPEHIDSGFHDVRPFGRRFKAWIHHHRLVLIDSWLRLWLTPASTLLAMLVMGLVLALPAGLYVLLENGRSIVQQWPLETQLSVYLHSEMSDQDGKDWAPKVGALGGVAEVEIVSKEEALQSFVEQSGLTETIRGLDANPLPVVLLVEPVSGLSEVQLNQLSSQLKSLEAVDKVRLDAEWLKRLRAIVDVAQRILTLIAVTLGLTVFFVVLSSTRLAIQNRADEIAIQRLFGATDAYIRRPFLYAGVWLGFWGSILALFLVYFSMGWLQVPLQNLMGLYQGDVGFHQMNGTHVAAIFIFGIGFAWLGAWFATQKHL